MKVRPRVEPHPQLTSEGTRSVVVEQVREFLAGDGSILDRSQPNFFLGVVDQYLGPFSAAWSTL